LGPAHVGVGAALEVDEELLEAELVLVVAVEVVVELMDVDVVDMVDARDVVVEDEATVLEGEENVMLEELEADESVDVVNDS
jgi:hypothetical protein